MSTRPDDAPSRLELPLCLRCAAPNRPAVTFCAQCGAPLSTIATTGPFETALMQARTLGEIASARAPSRIVLVGGWALCLAFLMPPMALFLLASRAEGHSVPALPLLLVVPVLLAFVLVRLSVRAARARHDAGDGEP